MDSDAAEIRSKELQASFNYWQGKRGDRLAPSRPEIVPPEITERLPRVFIARS